MRPSIPCGMSRRIRTWTLPLPSTRKFHRLAVPTQRTPNEHPPREHPRCGHAGQVESLDEYQPGGYHPVDIGDVFRQRYRVLHKLGHSPQSTTWLAHDSKWNIHVALKIAMSDYESKEAFILRSIHACEPKHRIVQHIPILPVFNSFYIRGPNGKHPCLVTRLTNFNLGDVTRKAGRRPFDVHVARHLSARLAIAVACTHKSGYVHSDIHVGNVLTGRLTTGRLSTNKLVKKFDIPYPPPFVQAQGGQQHAPSRLYCPIQLGEPTDEIHLNSARPCFLTGFEAAFRPENELRYESYLPLHNRPPEVRFQPKKPLSYASDIWSLACVIWEIVAVKPLFRPDFVEPDDVLIDQIHALGAMPGEWWEAWQANSDRFLNNEIPSAGRKVGTLSQRFHDAIRMPRRRLKPTGMSNSEIDDLFDMLRGMLMFKPEDRLSADQVLESAWMQKWALPNNELLETPSSISPKSL